MKKNTKSIIIRTAVVFAIVFIAVFLMKGIIYRMAIKYEDGGGRKSYELKDEKLTAYINQSLPNDESLDDNMDIETVIDLSLAITTDALDFSDVYNDNEPLKAFENGGANSVGYAAFTAATANYLLKRFGMDKEWDVKPKKGKLYLFGNNMSKKAKEGWFKDHDFVVFKNKNTKEEIYVDPTAFDYLGVRVVDKRQK